ncbi:MAG: porin [Phycisphaerales bacterium JB060]
MSHTKATVLLAGLAMGLGGTAIAQTSSLDEARSFAAETRSDASRATLSQGAATGPQIFGRLQFQYNVTIIDDAGPGGEDFANGFQNRRARLGAKGEVGDFDYYVQGNFDTDGGTFELLDYRIGVPVPGMEDDAKFVFGQFKSPFLYEELVSSGSQLAVDRSFVNSFFSQGRSQGISFVYAGNEGDDYKVEVNFSDGFNSANTRFDNPNEADFAIGGRFDYKVSGAWSDFKDFTSAPGQEQALRFGGAIFYQSGDGTYATGGATNELDLLSITADGQWESNGVSVYGAFILQDRDTMGFDSTDMGFIAQAGYRLDENQEIFGRFDYLIADVDGVEDFASLTFGYNYYVYGDQSAKFTVDAFFIFETVNDTYFVGGSPSQGLLPDAGDPQAGLRGQFQLSF